MKILFCPAHYIFDEYENGSEPYATFTICDRLAQFFPDSKVVTGKKNILKEKKYQIIEVQKNKADLDMSGLGALSFMIRYTKTAFAMLKKDHFDIIHHVRPFTIGTTFNLIPILGLNHQTPFVIGSFSSPYKNRNDPSDPQSNKRYWKDTLSHFLYTIFHPILFYLSIQTIKRASKVIVYDQFTKNIVNEYISEKKIAVIPPGKDKALYKIHQVRPASGVIKIIAVGNLIHRKGVDIIIRAISQLKTEDIELIIVGDGIERTALEKLSNNMNLGQKVHFLGKVKNKDIQKYYEQADIFTHMAREESHGQVYLEALAAGLPIITSDNVSYYQILKGKVTCEVVPQEDTEELAKAMVKISHDVRLRERMSREGRKHFEKTYDWDTVIIPKYIEVYKELKQTYAAI